jgi:predicted AlkP superfamily phosphohydrolase/phosphomutase
MDMTSSPKLLVLGLDAATFDLIDPWVAEGRLPHIKALMSGGTRALLISVPNLNSIPAWTSFMTGKNPGKHGLYWFYERQLGSYAYRYLNGSDIHGQRFWDYMSDSGLRVGVVNVPMTYPAYPFNGFMITGLDAPNETSLNFAYPAELYDEILARSGPYHIETNILGYARRGRLDLAVKATEEVIEQRVRTINYLLATQPWDVFVAVFTELDRVQHTFWRFMDPRHPDYDPVGAKQYGDVIFRFYVRLDEAIGDIVNRYPGVPVVINSDHGFGSNPESYSYLSPWLQNLGLFQPVQPRASDRLLRRAASVADGLLSQSTRRRIISMLPGGRAGLVQRLHQVRCDWSKTSAYTNYIHAGVWINLQGREPQGIVKPGVEYETLRQELIASLLTWEDTRTGQKIIKSAQRREEVYHGPFMEQAPDVVVRWNYAVHPQGLRYTRDGRVVVVKSKTDIVERHNVSGDHRPEGILILRGPGIRVGHQMAEARLEDIAPTLLYLAGLPVPDDMDGRVLAEAFEPAYLAQHTVTYQHIAAVEDLAERRDFSREEDAQVQQRLRDLGYLE